MIQINNVDKSYGPHAILKNFNLSIKQREFIGLIGNSGTGKTTILNLIAGIIKPDSGTVKLGDEHIGYIFQEPRLIPWKTVRQNVMIGAEALQLKKNEAKDRCLRILDKLEIKRFHDYYPNQLSGGIAQRVSIARAFFIEPHILLMDEPFTALDPDLRNRLHNYVMEFIKEKKIALLYVSHFPEDIFKITDKIYLLKALGRMERVANNKDLFKNPEDHRSYLHSLFKR